jgi:DNA repair exonuclease SbcCD ATPase subunit
MTIDELNDKITGLEVRILRSTGANQKLKDLHKQAETLRSQIQSIELEGEVDPTAGWRAQIDESKDAIAGISGTISMMTGEIVKLQKELPLAQFWEKAYGSGGIRNMLIDDIRALLSFHSNNYLSEIGGDQLALEFPLSDKRFDVEVSSPGGTRAIETYSTGEAERARLACILGLRDALLYRQKTPLRLLLLDDPLAHIDDAGIAGLVRMVLTLSEAGRTDQVLVSVPSVGAIQDEVPTLWVEKRNGVSKIRMGG